MIEPLVVTIGYEGKSIHDLVDRLRSAEVEVLVDVRLNAMSRKPGFSKRRLGEALAEVGIEYVHESRLGNPKENRPGFAKGTRGSRDTYLGRLDGEARPAFEDVLAIARDRPIALLCFEADHRTCHRTCITERMVARHPGLHVVDL